MNNNCSINNCTNNKRKLNILPAQSINSTLKREISNKVICYSITGNKINLKNRDKIICVIHRTKNKNEAHN